MPAKKPEEPRLVNPSALEARLRQVEQRIAERRAERATYLYRREQEPDKVAELDEMLAAVAREIAAAEQEKADITDTLPEATRKWSEYVQGGYLERLNADAQQVHFLGGELFELAKTIANHIEGLAPLLQQFQAVGAERANLAWGVIAAGTRKGRRPEGMRQLATMGTGAVTDLLAAALHKAGVGRLSPTTGIAVPPLPRYPARDGWVGQPGTRRRVGPDRTLEWHSPDADYIALAQEQLAREEAVLVAQMARSIEAVKEGSA